jgi:hypothetical protein
MKLGCAIVLASNAASERAELEILTGSAGKLFSFAFVEFEQVAAAEVLTHPAGDVHPSTSRIFGCPRQFHIASNLGGDLLHLIFLADALAQGFFERLQGS